MPPNRCQQITNAVQIFFMNFFYALFFISTITQALYITYSPLFLPLETVFRTHHLLDSRKEPVPDSRKEQPLPRKVI